MSEDRAAGALRRFVIGMDDWSELAVLGASIEFDAGALRITEPNNAPVYKAPVGEIAAGLLRHWARSTGLREWARVLLATGMIDLACLEDMPSGELLLEALWDCAEGVPVSTKALDLARQVATSR